ncbi:MAG: hypothetical protein LBG11_02070 [Bifidobacteriaceae bacterium]|jgi:hypothetical protein|nr:hypothetical protein [Bifidobacteriaceae bacterium]
MAPIEERPGTIPLRPLRLGDIFDGAFRSIRFAPSVMFGLTAVIVTIAAVGQSIPLFFLDTSFGLDSSYDSSASLSAGLNLLLSYGIGIILAFLSATILSGMLTYAVAQGAIGKKATIGSSWHAIGGRLPGLIGLSLLIGLIVILAAAIPMVLIIAGIGLSGSSFMDDSGGGLAAGIGMVLLGAVAAGAAALWITTRTLLAPAALVLEGQGIRAAIKHGWELSRGRFWRILGIYLLTSLIVGTISGMVSAPAGVIAGFVGLTNPALMAVVTALGSAIASLLTVPFTASVVALLYIDARIRSEGLDLALIKAAGEQDP